MTVLENQDWLLPRQLNQAAAARLQDYLGRLGIRVETRAKTCEFSGDGSVSGVVLDNGERIPADWVVISAGIRSNIEIARQAGLVVNLGIVVDDSMQTSHPDVWAAGDVAEHKGLVYGIWPPSQMQGTVAGSNAAGQAAVFTGVPRANSLKILGIDLYSIGRIQADPETDHVVEDVVGEDYACFIFNLQRMVGAILLGEVSSAPRVKKAIESAQDCSSWLAPSMRVEDVLANLN
jgi:nitrite reductase (NADH) large subunit